MPKRDTALQCRVLEKADQGAEWMLYVLLGEQRRHGRTLEQLLPFTVNEAVHGMLAAVLK